MLNVEQIRQLINQDAVSTKKLHAKEGWKYYKGEHDILQYKMYYYNADGILTLDESRSNSKICHPYFTELVDQLASFIMSYDEMPIQAKENAVGLQDHLNEYFDDEFWAEIQELITGTYAKGFEYLYAYKDNGGKLAFRCADSMSVVEVRAKDTDNDCNHIIYWYIDQIGIGENQKTIKRIEVFDDSEIWFYNQEDDGDIVLDEDVLFNPMPNVVWKDKQTGVYFGDRLGFVPFWRLDYTRDQTHGLKAIKGLIDDYDLMECGLSNNLQDFDKPIHLVRGFKGDNLDELQQNIKTKKILGVDDTGGLDILTVDVPYQARLAKAIEDEKNIYKFGMGFNASQVGDGNVTNVVIRSRYTLLELKANKLIKRLKRFLKDIIKVVLEEINKDHNTAYQISDVEIDFNPVLPTNEQENAQIAQIEAQTQSVQVNTLMNLAGTVGPEQALKSICELMDWDFESIKDVVLVDPNDELAGAMDILNGVTTDEQQTETGTETIPE